MQLSLPGAAYVYNGDELGLPNVDLPDWALQDPTWERSGHTERGRDAERVPMPWSGSRPPFGFTSAESSWLPMPPDWAGLTVQAQEDDPDSTLALYRRALQLRKQLPALAEADFEWIDTAASCLSYRRAGLEVLLNAGSRPVPLPDGEVLLASATVADGALPPDTAVWISTRGER
jgi:alpha-glucosidase